MMNTHELLELASLDAMGLLDPEERELFERAFRAAAPPVQAQIRREQTRLAGADVLLPSVDAPLGLKARVMAAVREAMQSVSGRRSVAGSIVPEIAAPRGVNRWWRAGAIGSLAAALVFGVFTLQFRSDLTDIRDGLANNAIAAQLSKDWGAQFERRILDPNTRLVQFADVRPSDPAAANPNGAGKALLLIDPDSKSGQLLVKNLPADAGEYSLVVVDENGRAMRAVLRFHGSGPTGDWRDIKDMQLEGGKNLAIIETSRLQIRGDVVAPVLRSNNL